MKTNKYGPFKLSGLDWSTVDWSQSLTDLAKKYKVSIATMAYHKKRHGILAPVKLRVPQVAHNPNNGPLLPGPRLPVITQPLSVPQFQVESNVPLILRGQGLTFPFATMAVGDSFFFDNVKPNMVAYAAKKEFPDAEWVTRTVKDGGGKKIGWRIWRTK